MKKQTIKMFVKIKNLVFFTYPFSHQTRKTPKKEENEQLEMYVR
jgi:hypothetical protein